MADRICKSVMILILSLLTLLFAGSLLLPAKAERKSDRDDSYCLIIREEVTDNNGKITGPWMQFTVGEERGSGTILTLDMELDGKEERYFVQDLSGVIVIASRRLNHDKNTPTTFADWELDGKLISAAGMTIKSNVEYTAISCDSGLYIGSREDSIFLPYNKSMKCRRILENWQAEQNWDSKKVTALSSDISGEALYLTTAGVADKPENGYVQAGKEETEKGSIESEKGDETKKPSRQNDGKDSETLAAQEKVNEHENLSGQESSDKAEGGAKMDNENESESNGKANTEVTGEADEKSITAEDEKNAANQTIRMERLIQILVKGFLTAVVILLSIGAVLFRRCRRKSAYREDIGKIFSGKSKISKVSQRELEDIQQHDFENQERKEKKNAGHTGKEIDSKKISVTQLQGSSEAKQETAPVEKYTGIPLYYKNRGDYLMMKQQMKGYIADYDQVQQVMHHQQYDSEVQLRLLEVKLVDSVFILDNDGKLYLSPYRMNTWDKNVMILQSSVYNSAQISRVFTVEREGKEIPLYSYQDSMVLEIIPAEITVMKGEIYLKRKGCIKVY